jgi:hypothetical protein
VAAGLLLGAGRGINRTAKVHQVLLGPAGRIGNVRKRGDNKRAGRKINLNRAMLEDVNASLCVGMLVIIANSERHSDTNRFETLEQTS